MQIRYLISIFYEKNSYWHKFRSSPTRIPNIMNVACTVSEISSGQIVWTAYGVRRTENWNGMSLLKNFQARQKLITHADVHMKICLSTSSKKQQQTKKNKKKNTHTHTHTRLDARM